MSSPRISHQAVSSDSVMRQLGKQQQNGLPGRTQNSNPPYQRPAGLSMAGLGSPVIPYQFPVRHRNGSLNGRDVPDTTTTPAKRTYITGNRSGPVEVSMTSRKKSQLNGPIWEAVPKFSRELRDTEVDEGDIVCFDAQYACHPRADVQWLKNGTDVVKTDWCLIYTNESSSMLVICDVNESDNAEYQVIVSNPAGKITSTAKLLVYIKGLSRFPLSDYSQLLTEVRCFQAHTVIG